MQYNFTDQVRLALVQTREIANEFRSGIVLADYIALALLRSPHRELKPLLDSLEIDAKTTASRLEALLKLGQGAKDGEIPYEKAAKKVIERAMAISNRGSHATVGLDHLFAGATQHSSGLRAVIHPIETADVVGALNAIRPTSKKRWWLFQ